MNHDKFEELLSMHLYNSNKSNIDKIANGNTHFANIVRIEFNDFLVHIRGQIGKIHNYITDEGPKEPKVITGKTNNFLFSYTIFPDHTSQIDISHLVKYQRTYKADFLSSKASKHFGWVYFLKSQYGFKIGCSSKIDKRVKSLGVLLPFVVELHSFVKTKNYNKLESFLHLNLSHKRINGEWFDLTEDDFIEIDTLLTNMELVREKELVIYDRVNRKKMEVYNG